MEIKKLCVGGIPVHVLERQCSSESVNVVFVIHGRLQTVDAVLPICYGLLDASQELCKNENLVCIAVELRNHNSRLVDNLCNMGPDQNPRHAFDMFAILDGTCGDISDLMDYAKCFLDRPVRKWGICGVSLGGHIVIQAMARDSRLQWGVSLIGCGDYLALMTARYEKQLANGKPAWWDALADLVNSKGAMSNLGNLANRKLLLINGGRDKLVPPAANAAFLSKLFNINKAIKMVLDEEAGHNVTEKMTLELLRFFETQF